MFENKFGKKFLLRFLCRLLVTTNAKQCSYVQDEMNLFQKYSFVLDMKLGVKILVRKLFSLIISLLSFNSILGQGDSGGPLQVSFESSESRT